MNILVRKVAHLTYQIETNCDFVLQSDHKDCVFDMELAFIAAQGFAAVSALKIVSDNLSLHDYHNLTHGVE